MRHFDVDVLSSSESAFDFARFLPCPIQSKVTSDCLPAAQYNLFSEGGVCQLVRMKWMSIEVCRLICLGSGSMLRVGLDVGMGGCHP